MEGRRTERAPTTESLSELSAWERLISQMGTVELFEMDGIMKNEETTLKTLPPINFWGSNSSKDYI